MDEPINPEPNTQEEHSDELPGRLHADREQYEASRNDPEKQARDDHRRFDRLSRALGWIAYSKVGKRLPDRMRTPMLYARHVISIYNSYLRMAAHEEPYFSEYDQISVPVDEHLTIPALFVIEMFPPSEIHNLERAIKKSGWNKQELRIFNSTPALNEARSGGGWTWWKLGAVARRNSSRFFLDATPARLPREFDGIELKALQIGQGITAVMACFYLRDEASKRVDKAWHTEYPPEIDWGDHGQWPQASGPLWVAYRATQATRGSIHQAARRWLTKSCPGIFSANDQPQPLIDILLFEKHDAALNAQPSRELSDALRAVGITEDVFIQTSRQIPAMILEPATPRLNLAFETRRTWGIWGRRDAILESIEKSIEHYGTGRSDSSITHYVHRAIEDYFLRLSITELLTVCEGRYAALRDTARERHGKFKMAHLDDLRSTILTLSLDVSSIERDAREYQKRSWRFDDTQYFWHEAPWSVARSAENGAWVQEPINLNHQLFTDQTRTLETLVEADSDYREILTAAASLTSSMEALRAGATARWIAIASLAVSLIAILLSDAAAHSRLTQLIHWLITH